MLDEQIRHKQMLVKQGTMTQMEKSLNRADLQGFKASETSLNAMVPGLFSESPLRNAASSVPRNGRPAQTKPNNQTVRLNLIAAEKAEYEDVMGSGAVKQSTDGHYN